MSMAKVIDRWVSAVVKEGKECLAALPTQIGQSQKKYYARGVRWTKFFHLEEKQNQTQFYFG